MLFQIHISNTVGKTALGFFLHWSLRTINVYIVSAQKKKKKQVWKLSTFLLINLTWAMQTKDKASMQMLKSINCQLITSLEMSISFSGIGTMGRLGCQAKMSQVGESMRLNTGKRNSLSVQFLYKITLKFKIKTNTLRHTKDSKAMISVFSRFLQSLSELKSILRYGLFAVILYSHN